MNYPVWYTVIYIIPDGGGDDDDGRRKNPSGPAHARRFYCATAYTHPPASNHTRSSHTHIIPMHLFGYNNNNNIWLNQAWTAVIYNGI